MLLASQKRIVEYIICTFQQKMYYPSIFRIYYA